jgi:hypothetical protein
MLQSVQLRVAMLALVSVAAIGGYWWYAGPTPQPQEYYDFADQRTVLKVPHALNVLSNLPFIVVGILGMAFLHSAQSHRPGVFVQEMERGPYWVYFIGLVLTGIGSSYFHANPCNQTLTWDRVGLAITFMALFTSILAERVHVACARWALWPLVLFGVGSVFYWDYTERVGAGDVRFYFIVQFFPLFILPVLLFFYPPRYTQGGDLLASLLCYGLAKALELLDKQVYTGAGFVSGHTLKHLVASLSAGFILLMLLHRQVRTEALETSDLAQNQAEAQPTGSAQ